MNERKRKVSFGRNTSIAHELTAQAVVVKGQATPGSDRNKKIKMAKQKKCIVCLFDSSKNGNIKTVCKICGHRSGGSKIHNQKLPVWRGVENNRFVIRGFST